MVSIRISFIKAVVNVMPVRNARTRNATFADYYAMHFLLIRMAATDAYCP